MQTSLFRTLFVFFCVAMLTPSQAESWFKKSPAEKVAKLSKAVEKAIKHLKQKQNQQKGKAPETAYLLQRLKQDHEDLKQEMRQKSGTEIDKDKRKAIAKRVRKAYTLHSRRKRLFYNATESSYRKIAPVLGKKAPARTDIKGAIEGEHENLKAQSEAAKKRAKTAGDTQPQSSASTDTTPTPRPAAEQGVIATISSYASNLWSGSSADSSPKQTEDDTIKPEKNAAPPRQPSSAPDTSDQSETVYAPGNPETPEKQASNLDAKGKDPQAEDTVSPKPEEAKTDPSFTKRWFGLW